MEGLATGSLTAPSGRAPEGLGLVQELVNTAIRQAGGTVTPRAGDAATGSADGAVIDGASFGDLLATAETADRWLSAALSQWSDATGQPAPDLHLGEADLAPLRRLREAVRALATRAEHGPSHPAVPATATVALRFDDDGRVRYGTAATGWRGVASLVATEILLAQRTGAWERFKACPYQACGVAFFDHTRNNNRVWHDVKICGNRTNLVASRARRRGAETPTA